jgi:hypothetical protein
MPPPIYPLDEPPCRVPPVFVFVWRRKPNPLRLMQDLTKVTIDRPASCLCGTPLPLRGLSALSSPRCLMAPPSMGPCPACPSHPASPCCVDHIGTRTLSSRRSRRTTRCTRAHLGRSVPRHSAVAHSCCAFGAGPSLAGP